MNVVPDPCLACGKQVLKRQESVECDWCSRWQHRTCGTGISRHAYREALQLGWLTYVCKPCLERELSRKVTPDDHRASGMHAFIRKLLSLRFLPAAHIERAVDYLTDKATTEATRGLVQYVRRQWLQNSTFRVEDWSVYKQTVRTNNDVEGWHHRVNGKAGGNSLGFYRLVPLLLREAELVTIAVETGDLSRYCSPRSIQQQAALETLWNHYVDGMKTSRFLERAGELYAIRQ